jgi:hypothetical protein
MGWQPTKKMRALGFYSVPLGQDGPDAWARAEQWNDRWDKTRRGEAPSPAMVAADNLSPERSEELTVYPPRALGEAFRRYRRTEEWAGKAPRTREDWWRGWKRIKPIFGDCDPRTVTLEDLSAWRKAIEETVSLREAHRCLKIWRALWKFRRRSATASAMLIRRLGCATGRHLAATFNGLRARWCDRPSARGAWVITVSLL